MILETKYELGEKVWYAEKSDMNKIEVEQCEYCLGEGKVSLVNGDKLTCPKCSGRGGEKYNLWLYKIVDHPSMIGKVEVTRYKNNEDKSRNTYMIYKTGVGSGTIWEEQKLFKTREECLSWCEMENKILTDEFFKRHNKIK